MRNNVGSVDIRVAKLSPDEAWECAGITGRFGITPDKWQSTVELTGGRE